jgi:hypothetical protein
MFLVSQVVFNVSVFIYEPGVPRRNWRIIEHNRVHELKCGKFNEFIQNENLNVFEVGGGMFLVGLISIMRIAFS